MLNRKFSLILHIVVCLAFVAVTAMAGRPYEMSKEQKSKLQKVYTNDLFTAMNINNIFSYYTNNGDGSLNPFTGDGGFELISADRGISIFEEGFLWGGKHMKDNTLKVGGSTYNHGLQAGRILTAGTTSSDPIADDASKSVYHIYRVRPDVGPANTLDDALIDKLNKQEVSLFSAYEALTAQDIYNQYVADWNGWPADQGAPYTDMNGDGVYDPTVDVPGVPGSDQTIWYVANDLDPDRVYYLSGSTPIGIEFQRTIWAYRRTGALGNIVFQKNIIINKSGFDVDSMFVAQWADPDLGGGLGYTDDVTGCDTLLSLGYVYNGDPNDGFYGDQPPATGFDFFQGPLVAGDPGDVGKSGGRTFPGMKNLGMTSFNFFINSNSTYADPRLQDPRGTTEWYNLMKGLIGRTGAQYVNPKTGNVTPFVLSGDPVAGTGWIEDGSIAPPGDRRMALCSGPFTLANGDTQEIVVAAIVGRGADYLNSVTVLKSYDAIAQLAYDHDFNLAAPPAAPVVKAAELDGAVVLNWGDPTTATVTESQDANGYKFQGYNVYQLPGSGFSNAKLLATYDLADGITVIKDSIFDETLNDVIWKPVFFGSDNGLSRTFNVTKDYIGGKPLVNGQNYYFAVTAYNYNPTPLSSFPRTLESSPQVIKVVPQSVPPGQTDAFALGDTIPVTHVGTSDGSVIPQVVNPNQLTGHQYTVSFDTSGAWQGDPTTWKLTDVTTGSVKISGQAQTAAGANPEAFSFDGMTVATFGPPPGMKDWAVSGTRQWTWVGGNWGSEGFNGAIGNAYDQWFIGSSVTYDMLRNVEIRFAGTDANGDITDANDPNASFGYRYLRGATAAPAQPSFAPFIVNATGGYAYQDYVKTVPLAAYDMEANPPRRLMVGYLENNATNGLVDGKYWPPYNADATFGDNIGASGPREWLFIFDMDYSTTPDASLQTDILNNTVPMMWFCTITRRDQNGYAAGWAFDILANHINTVNDQFTFTATAPTVSTAQAKADIQKINVFPNPYFGFNSKEPNKYTKFVTFNHLPQKVTFSIVNLAGVRVRKLTKDDPSQFFTWDLKNEAGLPVASGMYVVYMDLGSLGTKILKLAVIQEVQQLDKY